MGKKTKMKPPQNKKEFTQGGILDKIIHEPNRLRLMAQLYVVEIADMNFLKKELELTWGNLSSHVTKLENVDYVLVTKETFEKKSRTTIQLTQLGRDQFQLYRNHMKALLE